MMQGDSDFAKALRQSTSYNGGEPACLRLRRENPVWDKEKEVIVMDHTGQSHSPPLHPQPPPPSPAVTDLNLLRCPSNEPSSGNSPYRSICLPFFSVLSPGDSRHKNVFARCSIQYAETASPHAECCYWSLFKFWMMWCNGIFYFVLF